MRVGHLVLACRSMERGETAAAEIRQYKSNVSQSTKCSVWQVDLADFKSVVEFCLRVQRELPVLDGIICNAGVELDRYEASEGLERTLTINVVSTSFIAARILPLLQESARQRKVDTHLTVVGSCIHVFGPDEQMDVGEEIGLLETLSREDTADMTSRYNLSKLMVHHCFNELAKTATVANRGEEHHVIMNLVNPGWCSTELSRSRAHFALEPVAFAISGRTGEQGGRTLAHAMIVGRESHGCYSSESQIKAQSSYVNSSRGLRIQSRLWSEVKDKIEVMTAG